MSKRQLFYQLIPQVPHKNALIITGMRQVGKTTLMRQLFETVDSPKLWYDLDNPLDQKIFESEDYAGIYHYLSSQTKLGDERLTVFVDEVQNLPPITKVIKYLIDHFGVKFILTGSSSFYLKNLFPESLTGRKFLYELSPLSFAEFLHFKGILPDQPQAPADLAMALASSNELDCIKKQVYYQEYIKYGGFPEVVMTADVATKELVLKNIFKSFFEKDLQLLSDYKDIRELRDLILLLAPRVGSMLDVNKLADELDVSRVKIYAYLEFLQGTFFLHLLPKFSRSVDRSVAGGKKVYFADTGILHALGLTNQGQLLENTIVNQLLPYGKLSFYNQRNTAGIDVIVDDQYALEIKNHGTPQDLSKLQKYAAELGIPQSWVISQKFQGLAGFSAPHFI